MSFHAKQQSQRQLPARALPLSLKSPLFHGPASLSGPWGWMAPMVSPCRNCL